MKKLALHLFLFCSPALILAQEQIGIGAMAGITTYIGDFNNTKLISNPDFLVGGFMRYGFGDYYTLRITAAGGFLSGDPNTYSGALISTNITQTPQAFRTFFFTTDVRYELGFLPYNPFGGKGRLRFSPYFAPGLGILYYKNDVHFMMPFSIGFRYRLLYRWTLGVEWVIAKTFVDDIDNWKNVRSPTSSWFLNNDWVTYFNINLVYQIFDDKICRECDH
jgi:hypothetical protein